jgi:hypothetical protein
MRCSLWCCEERTRPVAVHLRNGGDIGPARPVPAWVGLRALCRWEARTYVRGFDGGRSEITRFARTRREAEAAVAEAVREFLRAGDAQLTASMPLVTAGELWLDQVDRPGSGLGRRTVADYAAIWKSYVDGADSSVRRLTLAQANDPQRLRLFLQGIADSRGTVSAQKTKALLSNVLEYAVDNDVLADNAMRRVRAVKAKVPKPKARDHTRAMTRAERDHVIAVAYGAAAQAGLNPRARRKSLVTADLVAFLGGTGVRIEEARRLGWSDVHLAQARVYIRGTKSQMSDRWLNLPPWRCTSSLSAPRALDVGALCSRHRPT